MEDNRIIELYWQRDESALAQTQQKYGAYCMAIARRILDRTEDAEECVNDTWLKAWNAIPPARPGHFRLFLAKITRNLAFNRFQELHAQKRGGGEIDLVLDELAEVVPNGSDVEDEVIAAELRRCIRRFASGLPEREAQMFIRRYFYMESVEQIAGRLDITPNHASVSLNRIRGKLRDCLEKEGFGL